MREIKFRQPIFKRGVFVYWHYFGLTIKQEWVSPTNASEDWDKFQQYTGLKDKNGKEIYEGDVVKCGSKSRVVEYIAEDGTQSGCFMMDGLFFYGRTRKGSHWQYL